MKKLGRLVWTAGISFTSFGVRIGVRTSTTELHERILAQLPAGWKLASSHVVERLYSVIAGGTPSRPNVRSFHVLYANVQRLARTENPDRLLEALESDVDTYIAQATRRWFFVHAGVIGWKGRAIVVPGRSLSGKTTLVKEFLQAGADYFSDEFAALDARGWVYPFPRPLCIRAESPQSQDRTRVRAEEWGSRAGSGPLPVALVLLTQYRLGARWRPRVLSSGKGMLGLLANAIAARRQPERALATLEKVSRGAQVLKGTRGEAKEVVESILQRVDSPI